MIGNQIKGKSIFMRNPEEASEAIEPILNGRVHLKHLDQGGFRTGLDSVMLAATCPAQAGQTVLDLGCGVGAAGLCVQARVPGIALSGVEIEPRVADLARHNATLNHIEMQVVTGDIRHVEFDAPFDHVICNPPYLEKGTYTPSPDIARRLALGHHEEDTNLADWLTAAHRWVKSRGVLTLIHRADHLDQILQGLGKRFGAIEVIPLWPHAGEPARRVMIRAIKDRRGGATLHPGLVLHATDGTWTPAAQAILRDMASI